jgi:hypothetical protein
MFQRFLGLAAMLALTTVALPAKSTTYNETFTFTTSGATCSVAGTDLDVCYETESLSAPISPAIGDQLNIDVTTNGSVFVPGSRTLNYVFATYAWESPAAATGPYGTSATLDMSGYAGPPNPFGTTPLTIDAAPGYAALGGFSGVPNSGFSFTGIESSATVTAIGPNPVDRINVGYYFGVPEPATWVMLLAGVLGIGSTMRWLRGTGRVLPAT